MELYLIPLILTIIIELSVAYLLGFRGKNLFLALLVINIITNPALNLVVSQTVDLWIRFGVSYILVLEAVVVVAEYLMLKFTFKNSKEPFFKLSFVMNATSFLIGILLLWH